MFAAAKTANRILVVRLGAMGDIIHTLPAVASLKHSYPGSHLTWAVEEKWAALLEENPFVDRVVFVRRGSMAGLRQSWHELRSTRYDLAIDFQGLIKSALVATAARPDRIHGFHHTQVRERSAALFYSNKTASHSAHVVDRNLDLAAAAGAASALRAFPLPAGAPEGDLPEGDFVLASPLAGWGSKQWPIEHYRAVASRLRGELGVPLVLNLPPGAADPGVEGARLHYSGLRGLIYATRRAAAVLGVDSGPLHLAAAVGKPGVAIFGPTDPARNGPQGDSIRVLRSTGAETTYKREGLPAASMQRVSPEEVWTALRTLLDERRHSADCLAR
jgi:heptosyltransferase-1